MECLGHAVKKEGRTLIANKSQCVLNMKVPKNKRQLRNFLIGVNFCRIFFKYIGHILELLSNLTRNLTFKWTEMHPESFKRIKSVITLEKMIL